MSPPLTKDDATYSGLVDSNFCGDGLLPVSLCVQLSDFPNVFWTDFCASIFGTPNIEQSHSAGVQNIIGPRYIFEIINMVVYLIAVLMVDRVFTVLTTHWSGRGRQESGCNNRMHHNPDGYTTITQRNTWVSAPVWVGFENATRYGQSLSVAANDKSWQRFDTALRRDFIQALKARYRSPLFVLKWFWGILVHVVSSLSAIGHAAGRFVVVAAVFVFGKLYEIVTHFLNIRNVYELLIDANVWSPAVYPQGWEYQGPA